MSFISINPYNQEENARFVSHEPDALKNIIEKAHKAFATWKSSSFAERCVCFKRLGELLIEQEAELAGLVTLEMGKPISETKAEIQKSADACFYYAENAERLLQPDLKSNAKFRAEIVYQPLGVIFGVFPWNFPFWQVIRFAAPSLMAGNVTIVKHAPNVPLCANKLQDLFDKAGFPPFVYNNVFAELDHIEMIVSNPLVKGVTLTGSGRAGSSLASLAGKYLKRSVLELGGSDPFIVLSGAQIEEAVNVGIQSRFINTGQSCIAAKRFILHKDIAGEFRQKFTAAVQGLKWGDPMDPATRIGPLARPDLLDNLDRQVKASVKAGAILVTGGKKPDHPGNFYEPAVLDNIPETCPAAREEIFGPVASLFTVADEKEAVKLANDTEFGLGATVWEADFEKAMSVARQIESGNVHINSLMRSSIDFPFGGVKNSGYGRELSEFGIREFVNIKTIAWPL